ncbi:MAG: hypothetical protein KKF68_00975 [Nanoarchaeota archaeon]|nr:hypothetical protein [Nanoarchaeota archaeon]
MRNLINLVSAHTGNDAYDHYMTLPEFIIGLIIIIGLLVGGLWLIKRKWRKK